jgi:uncharacterized membrane protein
MMWAVGLIIGGFIGAVLGNFATAIAGAVLGALAGLIVGALNARTRKSIVDRVGALESRVEALGQQVARLAEPGAQAGETRQAEPATPVETIVLEPPPLQPTRPETPVEPVPAAAAEPRPVRLGGSGDPRLAAAAPATTGPTVRVPPPPWLAWFMGVNTLARIGMLLLLIGVGFLAKYAVEHVRVPIEFRLSGIALGGIALLVVGWRLRTRRAAYAMLLQGGGVGVLYLTVFAAFRLYGLLPPAATIALLLLIAALSSGLAILQDAVALAVIAVVGGFLAPILTATSTGNHVFLFSYYALLNAAILGIAWFKAWRVLNLLGFVFTFVIGALWGAQNYRPELFATTEPFLVLFFLFYVGVATLYALRRSVELARYVDGTIVFGTPLVAAALQSALVRDMPFGMALSALAAAALYLGLAWILYIRRAAALQLLIESFLALGVIFATLAIPLALDARWTSATWALEGAAILWVGVRQRRLPARVFGLLLQLGAGIAYAGNLAPWAAVAPLSAVPVANSEFVGATLLALSGLYSAWLLWRSRSAVTEGERVAALLLFAWGNAWWLFAGWREIEQWVPFELRLAVLVGFITASAGAFAFAESRLDWPIARVPALALLPVLLVLAAGGALWRWDSVDHLFGGGGYVAWPLAFAVAVALLDRFDRTPPVAGAVAVPLAWWHAATLWLAVLIVAQELSWLGRQIGSGDGVWMIVPWGLVPALALLVVSHASGSGAWPMQPHRRAYTVLGAVPLAGLLVLWTLHANAHGDGDPLPLPYLPLFNPLDLTQALALVAGATWLARLKRDADPFARAIGPAAVVTTFTALGFFWVNAVVLRTIHFWFDIPYTLHAFWHSTLVQATFSLLWTLLALAAMLVANRGRSRPAWVAGAVLLGFVVVKLFLVDLGQAGTVERIVSFIGVGLLLLLIGYLAPVPPRRPEEAQ